MRWKPRVFLLSLLYTIFFAYLTIVNVRYGQSFWDLTINEQNAHLPNSSSVSNFRSSADGHTAQRKIRLWPEDLDVGEIDDRIEDQIQFFGMFQVTVYTRRIVVIWRSIIQIRNL